MALIRPTLVSNARCRRAPSRLKALIIALAACLPVCAQAALVACPSEVLRPTYEAATDEQPDGGLQPAPANGVNCTVGVPLVVDAGVTLWRCRVDLPEGDGSETYEPDENDWSYGLLLVRDGEPAQAYRDELMAGRYGAWHVIKADLDGDGQSERVVALWNAQGNGLGLNHWTLRVFDEAWKPLGESFEASEWSASSLVQAPAPRKGCDLAVASWVEDRSTGRDGIALQAQFLRLHDGAVAEAEDRPPLRRRYTNALERERGAHYNAQPDGDGIEGDVPGWLRNAGAKP